MTAIPAPRRLWRGLPFTVLEIRVDPPYRPAELTGSSDPRELGLQLYAAVLVVDPSRPGS